MKSISLKLLPFLFFACLLLSCKTQKFTLQNLPEHRLYIGSGGGFAAAYNEYLFLENGQVFYFNSLTKESKELKTLAKKEAKKIYKNLASLNLAHYAINKSGNMNYYIREVKGKNQWEVKWGTDLTEVPEELKQFYKTLQSKISQHE